MDKVLLERCMNLQEIAKEIWKQSYRIRKIGEDYGKHEEGSNLYGFYLRPIDITINTPFDIYFKVASDSYCRIINEFDEGRRYDGAVMAYEVMLNWLEGKYKFKYIPSTCEEFIEMIFDEEKASEITKYLCGVVQRLTRNALYCSKTKSSISETKYYTHDKERTYYTDIIKVEIDKPYTWTDGQEEANSHKIVDEHLMNNNKTTTVEDEIFGIDEVEEGLYKYLYNNLLTEKNRMKIDNNIKDNNRNHYIRKRLARDIDSYNSIVFNKDGVLKFGGNFLDFGKTFMSTDLYSKLELLKVNMKNNTATANILVDCIYELDVNILKEFVQILKCKDVSKVKRYCNGRSFRIIVDCILDEYFAHQRKIKEIYLYNESERQKKVKEVEKLIRSLERSDGTIGVVELKKIFDFVAEVYQINFEGIRKRELTSIEFKLDTMKKLGYVFVKVDNKTKTFMCQF